MLQRYRFFLLPGIILNGLIGLLILWLALPTLGHFPNWDSIQLLAQATVFWTAAYTTWRLPSSSADQRQRSFSFFLILFVINLAIPMARVSVPVLLWSALAPLVVLTFILVKTKWWPKLADIIYVTSLVVLTPSLAVGLFLYMRMLFD